MRRHRACRRRLVDLLQRAGAQIAAGDAQGRGWRLLGAAATGEPNDAGERARWGAWIVTVLTGTFRVVASPSVGQPVLAGRNRSPAQASGINVRNWSAGWRDRRPTGLPPT